MPYVQVRNQEVSYKAIAFYLEQHPLKLVRLLQVLTPNLDHSRVVHQLRKAENLPLAMDYLKSVQKVRQIRERERESRERDDRRSLFFMRGVDVLSWLWDWWIGNL